MLRWLRHPAEARGGPQSPVAGALYGTFPGGLLVLAIGIATIGPSVADEGVVAAVVALLAIVGIALAFILSVAFAALLFVSRGVEAQTVNGAWFIPPVVNIIVPVVLVSLVLHVAAADLPGLLVAGYAFWGMGFMLFVLVASLLYDRLASTRCPARRWRHPCGLASVRSVSGAWPWFASHPRVLRPGVTRRPSSRWSPRSGRRRCGDLGTGGWLRRPSCSACPCARLLLPYGLGWWGFTFPLGAFTAATLALARTGRRRIAGSPRRGPVRHPRRVLGGGGPQGP